MRTTGLTPGWLAFRTSRKRVRLLWTRGGKMLNSSLSISVEAKSHGVRLVEESRSLAAHLALEHRYRESRPVQESFLTFQNVGAAQIVPSPEVYEKARSRKGIVGAFERTCRRWKLDSDGQMILLGYRPTDVTGRCVLAGLWIPSSQDFL